MSNGWVSRSEAERQLEAARDDALSEIARASADLFADGVDPDDLSAWAENAKRQVDAAYATAVDALRNGTTASLHLHKNTSDTRH